MKNKKKGGLSVVSQSRIGTSFRLTALSRERSLRSGEFSTPQTRFFNVKLHVMEADEFFIVPECHRDLIIRNLKSRLELLVGIPVNFLRLQYLDEVDLDDNSTFKKNDIIPGGTLTLRIWSEDAWGHLVSASASGKIEKLQGIGATSTSAFSTANADLLGPGEKSEWLAHRAFVALFITVRRGHREAVEFLLQNDYSKAFDCIDHEKLWNALKEMGVPQHLIVLMCNLDAGQDAAVKTEYGETRTVLSWKRGADLKRKTPLGRTALHVAVTSGQADCIDILLNYGAKLNEEDYEGYTPAALARLWGQKESERRLFRHQWKMRAVDVKKPKLDERVGTSFQG